MNTTKTRGDVSVIRVPKEKVIKLENWLAAKNRSRKAIEDPKRVKRITDPHVIEFVAYVLGAEKVAGQHQSHIGEIYWLYFRADPQTQREFVAKLCTDKQLPLPDEKATPRQQLIHGLYGDDKAAITPRNGSPDTPAAKRVTWAIRKFEERVGLRKVKARKTRAEELLPRKTKDFLTDLYEKGTPKEIAALKSFIARAYGKKALKALPQAA